jgi:hypothetical protein
VNLQWSPAQSQADTNPTMLPGQVVIALSEQGTEMLHRVLRNTDPSVTDLKPDTIRLDFRGDHNPPTGGCELDGVGKKVQQCLLHRRLIS